MKAPLQTKAKTSLSAPPTFTPVRSGLLQRKCACGGTPGPTGECESCRKKKLQRRATNQGAPSSIRYSQSSVSDVPPIVHEVVRSPGQPLDAGTRAFFEPRFGHDFSKVRMHADAKAAESAQAVNALAYTVGQDVVLGAGQHGPQTMVGQRLLAHELAHTIQQGGNRQSQTEGLKVSDPNEPLERQAAEAADSIFASGPTLASFQGPDSSNPPVNPEHSFEAGWHSNLSGGHLGVQREVATGSTQQSPIKKKTLLFNPTKHIAPRPAGATGAQALVLAIPNQAQTDLDDAIASVGSGNYKVRNVLGGSSFAKTAVFEMGATATNANWLQAVQRAAGEANQRAEWAFTQITKTTPSAGLTQVKPNQKEVSNITATTSASDLPFVDADVAVITLSI